MSNYLSEVKDIEDLIKPNLWVIYGRSGSGKTALLGTFPKPMLLIKVGDEGFSTIQNVPGVKVLEVSSIDMLRDIARETVKDKKYATIAVDTFGLYLNEWQEEKAIKKKKRMTQQLWGDLKTDTEELIGIFKNTAKTHIVVLTCHEVSDTIEGMEDEIAPDIRPSVSKGARTYLEGTANFGIHTLKFLKEESDDEGNVIETPKFAAQIAANPYYWTKLQIDKSIKLPQKIVNPSYSKIMKAIGGK